MSIDIPSVILRIKSRDNELGGGFVAEFKSLALGSCLPPVEIVNWGSRFFIYKKTRSNGDLIYIEAMMYPLLPGATCEQISDPVDMDLIRSASHLDTNKDRE